LGITELLFGNYWVIVWESVTVISALCCIFQKYNVSFVGHLL
jgi:hypothetical protein